MKKSAFILIFMLLGSILLAFHPDSASIDFVFDIEDSVDFGISSVPVTSWGDAEEKADSVSVPPDGEKEVYVYWKMFSSSPVLLTLTGTEMEGGEGIVEWSASWDVDGSEKVLSAEDSYEPELVFQYEGNRLRSVGSQEILLETRVINAIPGNYHGKLMLEISSD